MTQENYLKANSLYTYLLAFLSSAVSIVFNIYSSTLFLSYYPATWLPYQMLSSAILAICLSIIISKAIVKNVKKNSQLILLGIVIFLIAFLYLRRLDNYWLPFIISCLIAVMNLISDVVIWNTFSFAFGLRDYKKVARYNAMISSGGLIIGSLFIPLLLSKYSLESLLVYTTIGLLICITLIHFLHFLKQAPKSDVDSKSIDSLKSPLFKKVLIFICFILVTQELTQYVFKYEIAQNFSGKKIGEFQGYYFSIANLLALSIGLTTTNLLLKLFHINGLLILTQGITLLACIIAFIYPSLWTVTLLFSTKHLFYYNYSSISIELILNIMPSILRSAAKFRIKTTAKPICTVFTYFLLLIMASYISTREILCIIAILLIPTFYYILKISEQYQKKLQDEAEFRRFNIIDELSPANATFFSSIASNALKSDDENIILFGLSLRDKIVKDQKVSVDVYQHLNHPNVMVKKAVIEIIKKNKDKSAIQPLQNRIDLEKDPEMKFWLIETLAEIDSASALQIARQEIKEEQSDAYTASVYVLLNFGEDDERKSSAILLHNLVKHSDPSHRIKAAYIIGKSSISEFIKDLSQLISDSDNRVCEAAIQVSANSNVIQLIPQVVKQLSKMHPKYNAKSSFIQLGKAVIPAILSEASICKDPLLLIKLLADIPGKESERALLTMSATGDIRVRSIIAKEINYRACKQAVSDDLKKTARKLALEEIANINFLVDLSSKYSQIEIGLEIISRIDVAKKNSLYWIAVATRPNLVNKLIPSLIAPENTLIYRQSYEKALELLEIYIDDVQFYQEVLSVFERSKGYPSLLKFQFNDHWLTRVINSQTNPQQEQEMDLLTKVFNLRQIELFKNLSGETLLAIAEETKHRTFDQGETIFNEGDVPDGLYCISSGNAKIIRQGKVLNILKTHDYFGELGLIDNMPRVATVIAETDCVVLFLEKNTFERITNDLPEVLWCLTHAVLRYLRQNLTQANKP